MPSPNEIAPSDAAARRLITLCAGLLPVWARHLAASRAQSEGAVSEMMQAFSSISPHVQTAERQSRQIAEALGDGAIVGLARACENALAPLLQHQALPEGGAQAIHNALDLVRHAVATIEQVSHPLSLETHAVAEQVERMYIGFQYQDRISQMLTLLEGDLARLQDALAGDGAGVPDLEGWLARLESHYAMAEQRQNHAAAGGSPAAAAADNETTFF